MMEMRYLGPILWGLLLLNVGGTIINLLAGNVEGAAFNIAGAFGALVGIIAWDLIR